MIKTRTINQQVYSRITELLGAGHWELGSRIDERELSEELGVSRTPLREAIGRLVSEGVIEHRPYQGNFVRSFTLKQVEELFEVRIALESLAAKTASERITSEEIAELREIVTVCHAALEAGDMEGFEAADRAFHHHIVKAASNEVLEFSLRTLTLHIQLIRHVANSDPSFRKGTKEHRAEVVEALDARDGELAADLLARHIEEVHGSVRNSLASPSFAVAN